MKSNKILIGMSGGVDSSVAAFLLRQEGHDCVGATMRLFDRSAEDSDDSVLARQVAEKLGMKVFLLTDCIINKEEKDICNYPQGSFDDLKEYISTLIK